MIKKDYLEKIKLYLNDDEYNKYLKSLNENEKHGFTINLNKLKASNIDLDFILNKFDAKVIYENKNYAYLLYDKINLESKKVFPGKDALYHAGLYYIQEPSAASVLFGVEFNKSDVVLDICASPGGKSCEALYNLDISNGGFLIANEIKYDRAKILSSNIERMGFDNAIVTNNNVDDLSNCFYEYFDKIIVDAPCSGEGMFRKSEEAINQWSDGLVKSCARIQKEILDKAYIMLKKGGILIYSTCTFSKEEDEENVEYMQNKYNDLSVITSKKIYPFEDIGEGQFFTLFKKGTDDESNNLIKTGMPDKKSLKNLKILRYGFDSVIDEYKCGFNHAMTHNDKIHFENIIELDDNEIIEYLHGDVIRKKTSCEGWCKITYKGLGVGLGKIVNGMIKNHYPKGLRNLTKKGT